MRVWPTVQGVLRRVLGPDDPEYEDILQSALERVVQTVERATACDCPMTHWAAAVTRNVAIDALRARSRDDLQRRMIGHQRIADFTHGMFGRSPDHVASFVTGMAMKPDGTVAARFSDTVELDLEKHDLEEFSSRPYHYENQFYIAGGQYTLKLAVSSGEKYGQFEVPLVVDHYDPAKFSMSDLALSRQFYKIADPSTSLDALLLQDRTPLVTQGLQLVPSGSNSFKKSDQVAIYLEVYEPASVTSPKIGLRMRILDKKTGESRLEASVPDTASSVIPGNPVVPMGVPLPVNQLQPGTYVVELRATEASGKATNARKAEFSIE